MRTWTRGIPHHRQPGEPILTSWLYRYDQICTPRSVRYLNPPSASNSIFRVAHAVALLCQLIYIGVLTHYILWPDIITIFADGTPQPRTRTSVVDISSPREILLIVFSLSDTLCRPISPRSAASFITFLAFLLSFPSSPIPDTTPFLMLLLAFTMHVFNLHFSFPSPALLFSPARTVPMLTLFRLLIAHALRPAFYFATPILLVSTFLLSASLGDIGFQNDMHTPAPAQTRLTMLMLMGFGLLMFFFIISAIILVFPSIISPHKRRDPRAPVSQWDRYEPTYIGLAARRDFVALLLVYSRPHYFPYPIAIIKLVFVSIPAAIIRLTGRRDVEANVRNGVQAVLWRVNIAPVAIVLAGVFWRFKKS